MSKMSSYTMSDNAFTFIKDLYHFCPASDVLQKNFKTVTFWDSLMKPSPTIPLQKLCVFTPTDDPSYAVFECSGESNSCDDIFREDEGVSLVASIQTQENLCPGFLSDLGQNMYRCSRYI